MRKGSLCSGYGGLDSALPGELAWVSEVDEAASRVLKREHPGVPNLGDLTAYPWSAVDYVALLAAGFPCQPISVAGRQKAHDDHRWLWPDVLSVIARVRPDEIFLENVPRIVSILKGAVLAEVLAGLRDAGYAARWTVLGACTVGAPHHRHRWFLRAARMTGPVPEAERLAVRCGVPRGCGYDLLPTPTARDGNHRGEGSVDFWQRRAERGKVTGMPLGAAAGLLVPGAGWGRFATAVMRWEEITGVPAPVPTVARPKDGMCLNPELSEWMMGLRPGLVTADMARNDALRVIGNGVVPRQARAAWDMLAP